MSGRLKLFLVALAVAFVAWSGILFLAPEGRLRDSQSRVFVANGSLFFSDYYMPWKCANEGYRQESREYYLSPDGRVLDMEEYDRCYPAFAMLLHRVLPFSNLGALIFDLLGALLYLATLYLCLFVNPRSQIFTHSISCFRNLDFFIFLSPLLLALTAPFIFSLERANTIWYSAAAVAVFIAWWNDERKWKRYVAAACLAIAAVLKIAPAVLGVMYFSRIFRYEEETDPEDRTVPSVVSGLFFYRREILISIVVFLVLFFVPFFGFGGWDGVIQFFHNAAANSEVMSAKSALGFYPFVRRVKLLLGMDWHQGVVIWKLMTQALGILCLVNVLRPCNQTIVNLKSNNSLFFAVAALLLVPGNMMFYGFLYLVPVLVMELREQCEVRTAAEGKSSVRTRRIVRAKNPSAVSFFLWFAILCPFQLVIFGHTLNLLLANLAFLVMIAWRLVPSVGRRG